MEGQLELTAESLWAEVAGRLKGALNTTTYRTWFAGADGEQLTDDEVWKVIAYIRSVYACDPGKIDW